MRNGVQLRDKTKAHNRISLRVRNCSSAMCNGMQLRDKKAHDHILRVRDCSSAMRNGLQLRDKKAHDRIS